MVELQQFQQAAKSAVYQHFRTRSDNPLVVIPAGGGTTSIIASICDDVVRWGGRLLVVVPGYDDSIPFFKKLVTIRPGPRKSDAQTARVVIASIGSVERQAIDVAAFDIAILADAHLIDPRYDRRYRQLVTNAREAMRDVKVVGFAAISCHVTFAPAYAAKPLCSPEGFLNQVCFEIGVRELIVAGVMTPVVTKAAVHQVETETLPLLGGDFDACEAGVLIDDPDCVKAACEELVACTRDRRAVLIYPAEGGISSMSLEHCLREYHDIEAATVYSAMTAEKRADVEDRFLHGRLKYLIADDLSNSVFGAAHIDCVVLLQPTLSPGLYAYMVMPGLRLHPNKPDLLVLDFVGNALRHGPVDQLTTGMPAQRGQRADANVCRDCRTVFAIDGESCPDCGGKLLPPKYQRVIVPAGDSGSPVPGTIITEHAVRRIDYAVHSKRYAAADAPKTMRVDYHLCNGQRQSEFVCFEHKGFPQRSAEQWWRQRSSERVPSTAERAVAIARSGRIAHTARITVRHASGERYSSITAYELVVRCESASIRSTADDKETSSDAK